MKMKMFFIQDPVENTSFAHSVNLEDVLPLAVSYSINKKRKVNIKIENSGLLYCEVNKNKLLYNLSINNG